MPATNTMPSKIAKKTNEVPRSGCLRTNRNGTTTNAATGIRSQTLFIRSSRESNRWAREMIMISFANSDGCKVMGPSWIQRCAPNAD